MTHDTQKPKTKQSTITGYVAFDPVSPAQTAADAWLVAHGENQPAAIENGRGGVMVNVGRLVVEGGGGGMGSVYQIDTHTVARGNGGGYANAGLMIVNRRWLRVYSLAGLSGEGGGLSRTPTDGGEPDNAGWGGGQITVGLGVDFSLTFWRLGLVIGLRGGYQYGLLGISQGSEHDYHPPAGPFVRVIAGARWNS